MTALILVAAGSGQRLGAGTPKAFVEVGGRSLLQHCLDTAQRVARLTKIIVVAPAGHVPDTVAAAPAGVTVVPGGATRDASVRAGLAAIDPGTRNVLIQDAARPFVPAEVFDRVIDGLAAAEAVVPAIAVADTIKQVRHGVVVATPARDDLVAVQTPQGFRCSVLQAAHEQRAGEVTDDAMLAEQAGIPVHVVAGDVRGFKVTTPFDLLIARALLEDD